MIYNVDAKRGAACQAHAAPLDIGSQVKLRIQIIVHRINKEH